MIQTQLVDYISAQKKAGVSRDAIKSALVGAGWQTVDVEDTLKSTEMVGQVAPASVVTTTTQQPTASSPSVTTTTTKTSFVPADIIGGINPVSQPSRPAVSSVKTETSFGTNSAAMNASKSAMGYASVAPKKSGKILVILEIIIILALIALSGYLYMQNTGLTGKIATLNSQSGAVSSQVGTLTTQVQALTASDTALMAQQAALTAQNQDLAVNLSFFLIPQGDTSSTIINNISGITSGSGTSYTILTDQGAKLMVKNATDPQVASALSSVVGKTAQFSLSYVPGTRVVSVMEVNGAPTSIMTLGESTTTTASSTPAMATP